MVKSKYNYTIDIWNLKKCEHLCAEAFIDWWQFKKYIKSNEFKKYKENESKGYKYHYNIGILKTKTKSTLSKLESLPTLETLVCEIRLWKAKDVKHFILSNQLWVYRKEDVYYSKNK